MKKDPLHIILSRIRPMSPFHQAQYLRGLIASEPRRSIRRRELESLLRCVITKQVNKEVRDDRRAGRRTQQSGAA
jgi:hypothetical protein